MARSYNRRPRRALPKRNMFWARSFGTVALGSDNTATQAGLLNSFNEEFGASLFGFTVTRIRGYWTHYTPDVEEPSTTYHMSLGIRTDERIDAGQADTDPEQLQRSPFEDPYSDWMYARNSVGIRPSPGDLTSTGVQLGLNKEQVDIKSQRKLSELGESLYMVAEHNLEPELAEVGVVLIWDFHILLKQP